MTKEESRMQKDCFIGYATDPILTLSAAKKTIASVMARKDTSALKIILATRI